MAFFISHSKRRIAICWNRHSRNESWIFDMNLIFKCFSEKTIIEMNFMKSNLNAKVWPLSATGFQIPTANINYNYSQLMNWRRLPISTNDSLNKRHVTKYFSYNYRRIIKFIGNSVRLRKFIKLIIQQLLKLVSISGWQNLALLSIRNENLIVALIFSRRLPSIEDCEHMAHHQMTFFRP